MNLETDAEGSSKKILWDFVKNSSRADKPNHLKKKKIQEDAEEKEKVMPFAVEGDNKLLSKGEGLLRKSTWDQPVTENMLGLWSASKKTG